MVKMADVESIWRVGAGDSDVGDFMMVTDLR